MSQIEVCSKLINKTNVILNQYEKARASKSIDFNVFSILDIERSEVITHSNMLYAILNPKGNHRMGDKYLIELLKVIGLSKEYQCQEWEVYREYVFDNGRIDFLLKTQNKCVVIELKIDAGDQEKQLIRYEEFAKSIATDYRIYYLTLDGRSPLEQSVTGVNIRKFMCISFCKHIRQWLDLCIDMTLEENIECSFLKQYAILIEKLVGENNMNTEIRHLFTSTNELKAAIALSDTIAEVKSEILLNFLETLKARFKAKGYKTIVEDIDCAKDYFNSSQIPFMSFKIKEFSIGKNKTAYFSLGIEVEYTLNFYIGFYIQDGDEYILVNSDEFSERHKRIYRACEAAITNTFGKKIRKNNYDSILWQPIKDMSNHNYDFKRFSSSCINLMETYQTEASRIADKLASYIKSMTNELEKEIT